MFNTGKTRINCVNTEMEIKRGVEEKVLFSEMLVYYIRVFLLQINVKVFESLTYEKIQFYIQSKWNSCSGLYNYILICIKTPVVIIMIKLLTNKMIK